MRCLAIADGNELVDHATSKAKSTPARRRTATTCSSLPKSGTLSCLNAADGKERWQPFSIDAPLRCSPTIAAGRVMLSGCDSLLHIINVPTARKLTR